jgi:uncharacterized caspase-like protein
MKKLAFCDDDAQQLFDFFRTEEGGEVPLAQMKLLKDHQATKENILQAANQLFSNANPEDLILFYFSGHGLPGAFLPVDSDGEMQSISHQLIMSLLRNSPANHKMVIADACHSGSFNAVSDTRTMASALPDSPIPASGSLGFLLSSGTSEYSHEFDGISSGVFSHFLIRGLKGEAEKNSDGFISVTELFHFVYEKVRRFTKNIQSPVFYGHFDEHLPVSVLR